MSRDPRSGATAEKSKEKTATSASAKRRGQVEAARRREKRRVILLTAGSVVFIALAVLCLIGVGKAKDSGFFKRNTVVAKSENYKVDKCMFSYFFYDTYMNFVSDNQAYLNYMGLDVSKPLQAQKYSDDMTWYDFFLGRAKARISQMLYLNEDAGAAGFALGDEDLAKIDSVISNIAEESQKNGRTIDEFLSGTYGPGVRERDLRKCIELSELARKYYDSEYEKLTDYTGGQIDKYYGEHSKKYQVISYLSYAFKFGDGERITDPVAARETADKLAACSDEGAFRAWLVNYISNMPGKDGELPDPAEVAKQVGEALTPYGRYDERDENPFQTWAFSGTRSAGDTYVLPEENSITVFMLTEPARRLEGTVRNMRHILLRLGQDETHEHLQERAQALLDKYLETKSVETFAALAKENTTDEGSRESGGLYEDVCQGYMVEQIDDWLFDPARKAGDTGIVASGFGAHVVLLESISDTPTWQHQVIDDKGAEDSKAWLEKLEDEYPVKIYKSRLLRFAG